MSWEGKGYGAGWNRGGAAAPVGRNPFAPGGSGGPGQQGQVGVPDEAATGPILGKGSELQRIYNMPPTMGHDGGVNCMTMGEGKVYSGGRDEKLFVWQAGQGPNGFQLTQDCPPIVMGSSVTSLAFEESSKWLFCGLWNGEIRGFCKSPIKEERLQGHRRSVASLLVHSSVLISGSNDGTVRLWTCNPQTGGFQSHGQPLTNPSGPVNCMKMMNDSLWVGGHNGITNFDLATLQPKGTLQSQHQVTGLVDCQGYMLATYRNGEIKIFDGSGSEIFSRQPAGEHTSNTAVEMMMHPIENKPMVLCGQQFGYITAYDLPEFRPRGSFVCKDRSDTKAILDVKSAGMFLTAGFHGDIMVWQWGAPSGQLGQGAGVSPFAPAPGGMMASSPFAPGGMS